MDWVASRLRKTQPCSRTVFTEHTFGVANRRCGAHARCPRRNNPCQNVSLHGKSGSGGAPNSLCPQPETRPTHFLSSSQCSTGSLSTGGPHNEALVTNLERATELLHITPASLQSSDGRRTVSGRDAIRSTQEKN